MKKPQITVRFNQTGEQTEVVSKQSKPTPNNKKVKEEHDSSLSTEMTDTKASTEMDEAESSEAPKLSRRKKSMETPFYLINEDDLSRLTQEETKAEIAAASDRNSSSMKLEDTHYNIKFYDDEETHHIDIDERVYSGTGGMKRSNGKSPYPFMVYSKKNIFSSMKNYNFPKLVATVAGAVVTGCLLGYVVLFLFFNPIGGRDTVPTTQSGQNGTANPSPTTDGTGQNGQAPIIDPNGSVNPTPTLNGTKLTVPASTYYVVQGGVFTEKSGADIALQTQVENGWGGLVTPVAPYRLFVGVTSTKEQAEPLKNFYTTQGTEVYVKEWTIGSKEVEFGNEELAKNMQQFFQTSTELVNQMSQFTSSKISGNEDSDASLPKKIEEIYTEATNKGIALIANLKEVSQTSSDSRLTAQILAIEEMIQATQNAVYAYREYQKQPNDSYLWDMQDGMMNYVLSFEKWYVS